MLEYVNLLSHPIVKQVGQTDLIVYGSSHRLVDIFIYASILLVTLSILMVRNHVSNKFEE